MFQGGHGKARMKVRRTEDPKSPRDVIGPKNREGVPLPGPTSHFPDQRCHGPFSGLFRFLQPWSLSTVF